MNGVCVRWRGWIDLDRLEGIGCLEFDEKAAAVSLESRLTLECLHCFALDAHGAAFLLLRQIEDAMLRDQIERYNQRLREFDEKQRVYRQQQERLDTELDVRHHAGHAGHAGHAAQRHALAGHGHAAAAAPGPHPHSAHLPMQYRA